MLLEDLKADLEKGDITYKGLCYDCKNSVTIDINVIEDGTITIEGGAVYKVKQGMESIMYFKCDECFRGDKTLRNWKPCEVYSRVVGYLRPVQQWNKGKQVEYDMRKEFTNTKGVEEK